MMGCPAFPLSLIRGHGSCNQGFCKCYPGWYGIDCSRKRKGLDMEPGDEEKKPWLKSAMKPVAAAQTVPPASPTRKRPFVYVYDTHPEFNTDVMQYRCVFATRGSYLMLMVVALAFGHKLVDKCLCQASVLLN